MSRSILSFIFLLALNEALTESTELYRNKDFTPEDNALFVQRFMPRLVVAIGRLCDFVNENK